MKPLVLVMLVVGSLYWQEGSYSLCNLESCVLAGGSSHLTARPSGTVSAGRSPSGVSALTGSAGPGRPGSVSAVRNVGTATAPVRVSVLSSSRNQRSHNISD